MSQPKLLDELLCRLDAMPELPPGVNALSSDKRPSPSIDPTLVLIAVVAAKAAVAAAAGAGLGAGVALAHNLTKGNREGHSGSYADESLIRALRTPSTATMVQNWMDSDASESSVDDLLHYRALLI